MVTSKKPGKQRLYRYTAPLHQRHKFLGAHLSKELKKNHKSRSVPVIKGDKVKVMRGHYRGKEGKVERVDLTLTKVFVTGIDTIKKDGSKALYPLEPSNLMITELNLNDKRRMNKNG